MLDDEFKETRLVHMARDSCKHSFRYWTAALHSTSERCPFIREDVNRDGLNACFTRILHNFECNIDFLDCDVQ